MDSFVGEIRLFGFPRIPTGWLACNGQPVSVAEYSTLYAVIGTTYGGDGSQTFNLPDLRGRVPIGLGTGRGLPTYALGQPGGQEAHTLIEAEMPSHSHGLMSSTVTSTTTTPSDSVHLGTVSAGSFYATTANAAPYVSMAACIGFTGDSVAHDNMMPTLVCNYCISYVGVFPSPG